MVMDDGAAVLPQSRLAVVEKVLSEHRYFLRPAKTSVFIGCGGSLSCTWGGAREPTAVQAAIQHDKHVARMIMIALREYEAKHER